MKMTFSADNVYIVRTSLDLSLDISTGLLEDQLS